MNGNSTARPGRRGVLQAIAAAATAAGLAGGLLRPVQALPLTKEVRERSRYRMTEHIRRFYETNRY